MLVFLFQSPDLTSLNIYVALEDFQIFRARQESDCVIVALFRNHWQGPKCSRFDWTEVSVGFMCIFTSWEFAVSVTLCTDWHHGKSVERKQRFRHLLHPVFGRVALLDSVWWVNWRNPLLSGMTGLFHKWTAPKEEIQQSVDPPGVATPFGTVKIGVPFKKRCSQSNGISLFLDYFP